jgi:EAL domain-containing protein (putative c-di-GMP-specific phosphodiesterase class I)
MDSFSSLLPLPSEIKLATLPDGTAIGRFLRTDLSSVFQPIFHGGNGRIVGHEAFVRAHGGGARDLTPWNLFSLVANDETLVALDRLCRAIHAINFLRHQEVPGRLFLNVHGRLLAAVSEDHGHVFRAALDKLGLAAKRIVIETPEIANADRKLLALVLSNYRLNGFLVAASTQGIADLEALLRVVRPDFVKIDGRQVCRPADMDHAIALTRGHGIRPVFSRVESSAQREYLLSRPDVLLQGWALAEAHANPLVNAYAIDRQAAA